MQEIRSFRGDHFFLSNFYRSEFSVEGLGTAQSGEHAYNALKSVDHAEQRRILEADSPASAKALGQSITLRDGWNTGGRVRAMVTVTEAKFAVPEMAARLLATAEVPLVEGNSHHDNFWGDCTCDGQGCRLPGKNMLGEILMAVRSALPAEG